MKLPDLEAMAIFSRVAELRSFSRAALDLKLSKATVSKAVARLETRLGTPLLTRTSRRLALTDQGRKLASRASAILADAESAQSEAQLLSAGPRGLVRLAAPMSFGVLYLAPLIPEFLRLYPDILIDLSLSDAQVDIVGEGFDAAIRIGTLSDSALVARRLCAMPLHLVGAPQYLKAHGRPRHPMQLADHVCLGYAYQLTGETWRFRRKSGEVASVKPQGPLRVNNGEAMLPSLVAGIGLGVLPEFILRDALRSKKLEVLLSDWSLPGGTVYWVTPPGRLKPKRNEVLASFLARKLHRPEGGLA